MPPSYPEEDLRWKGMISSKDHLRVTDNYLSVRQPYAWAIIEGFKDVENRDWSTKIRGRIYIHASKTKVDMEEGSKTLKSKRIKTPPEAELVFGAIIGSVEITDCVESSRRWWFSGRYGFLLANPKALPHPIPMKANAKMQRVPSNILRKIKRLK
jgi:hypothetical protein